MANRNKQQQPTNSFSLTMANADGAPVTIITGCALQEDAIRIANYISAGLTTIAFRGCVIFTIFNQEIMSSAAVVTFADDFPNGIWNVTLA